MKLTLDFHLGPVHISLKHPKYPKPPTIKDLNSRGIWVTKECDRIPVAELKTDHLINIAKMLIKRAEQDANETALWYTSCPEPRGEMAQVAFDQECDFWLNGGDEYTTAWVVMAEEHAIWKYVVAELEKRHIDIDNVVAGKSLTSIMLSGLKETIRASRY